MDTHVTYVGDDELGGLTSSTLDGSGMKFTCIDPEKLDNQTSGDVFITESSVKFALNETPKVNLRDIVVTVRQKLQRSVPMVILVFSEERSEPEVAGLPSVRVVEDRTHLSQIISELLQPTT